MLLYKQAVANIIDTFPYYEIFLRRMSLMDIYCNFINLDIWMLDIE